jgi:hypothetical protein
MQAIVRLDNDHTYIIEPRKVLREEIVLEALYVDLGYKGDAARNRSHDITDRDNLYESGF